MARIGSINAGGAVRQAVNTDFGLAPSAALDQVDRSLALLEGLVHRAGEAGCDIAALPEDTLGLWGWEAGNRERLGDVLPEAVARMLDRLGRAAAAHRMYLVCASNTFEAVGVVRNTAFLLGRDGREMGRYCKVTLPVHEHLTEHGERWPVFETPDLGGVGLLTCYDMVFPESARCLALGGADILFHPTAGGAAHGGDDISRAAFRTRAVENCIYITVSWGGWGTDMGSMILSPQGEILVEEKQAGEVAIADIDPLGGRECGDWSNWQADMRARLFCERRPGSYRILTDPEPPVLKKLPPLSPGSPEEISRIVQRAMTQGHLDYQQAEEHARAGRIDRAIDAFEALRVAYPGTWFDRTARERLQALRSQPGR